MTLRDAMIEWLSDCFEGINFDRMSTGTLIDGIERHWDGGMESFLDACVDVTDLDKYAN
jgi:hypothetical protein